MTESRRRAYLEALGIDVWVAKPPPGSGDRLFVGPGSGDILLLCNSPEESATRLAGDISRALGGGTVWAWPEPGATAESPTLTEVLDGRRFILAIAFGGVPGDRTGGGDAPAGLLLAPALVELTASGAARAAFWRQLRRQIAARDLQ